MYLLRNKLAPYYRNAPIVQYICKSIYIMGVMNLKRMMGVMSTVVLIGTMVFGGSNGVAHADTTSKPY